MHPIPQSIFISVVHVLFPLDISSHYACQLSHGVSYPTMHFIFFQQAFYPIVHAIPSTGHLILLCMSFLPLGILSHSAYHLFHRVSYPTVYIISLSILSRCAYHPTGHLILLCMSSLPPSILSHCACHPSFWASYPMVPIIFSTAADILSSCAYHPTKHLILLCMSSHWASYPVVHVITPTGHFIPLCMSSFLPGILSHYAYYPSHRTFYPVVHVIPATGHLIPLCSHLFY